MMSQNHQWEDMLLFQAPISTLATIPSISQGILVESTYTDMSSSCIGWQSVGDFDLNMGYKRIDDLVLTFGAGEGTSNHLDENENEDVVEEEDPCANERVADVVHKSESSLDQIR
ncbi:hypothetical protein J1N35_018860 [Gossypium stocksii]|uniref:Uncharacterized protein n=1 Tax=Gossypium stocksii TaxID=47602 RepID=A0A9D3VRF8_9ROSI|nr:hypothetical protein J1N35_018860 [Gossypium stocksii]